LAIVSGEHAKARVSQHAGHVLAHGGVIFDNQHDPFSGSLGCGTHLAS
jgi:hypothetical protein